MPPRTLFFLNGTRRGVSTKKAGKLSRPAGVVFALLERDDRYSVGFVSVFSETTILMASRIAERIPAYLTSLPSNLMRVKFHHAFHVLS
jgi:hypothetical protein